MVIMASNVPFAWSPPAASASIQNPRRDLPGDALRELTLSMTFKPLTIRHSRCGNLL
jgi:hypothetical protein